MPYLMRSSPPWKADLQHFANEGIRLRKSLPRSHTDDKRQRFHLTLRPSLFHHTRHSLSSRNHRAHKKEHSQEKINSSAFPLQVFEKILNSLGISPTRGETCHILGSLTLPSARVTTSFCLPRTVLIYYSCWLQNYRRHPFSLSEVSQYRG